VTARGTAPRRVVVIHNPAAGRRRGRFLAEVLRGLEAAGLAVERRVTRGPGDAQAYAAGLRGRPLAAVVAAGGDGTVNEVCNGLAGDPLPLGLIPLGTANVLAAELGLPADPRALARVIAGAPPRPVWLARANGRLFAAVAGAGFDAWVVAGVNLALKRRLGKGAYALETLRRLVLPPPADYRVTVDGRAHRAASVVVCNGRHYAGRYVLAPEADLARPEVHACLFTRPGRRHLARYILATLAGRAPALADVRILPGRRVEVSGPAGPVQADGDVCTRLPLVVEGGAARLRVLAPAAHPATADSESV